MTELNVKYQRLTSKRASVLTFIWLYNRKFKRPPTVREIQAGTKLSSTSMVDYYVNWLISDGYLSRIPGIARGLEITTVTRVFMKWVLSHATAEELRQINEVK